MLILYPLLSGVRHLELGVLHNRNEHWKWLAIWVSAQDCPTQKSKLLIRHQWVSFATLSSHLLFKPISRNPTLKCQWPKVLWLKKGHKPTLYGPKILVIFAIS